MRIFWLNGGLTLRPSDITEERALERVRSFLSVLLFTDGMEKLGTSALGGDNLNDQEPVIESSEFGVENLKEFISRVRVGSQECTIAQDLLRSNGVQGIEESDVLLRGSV
jgi:hypothetical protein